jgi:hypothetical protein
MTVAQKAFPMGDVQSAYAPDEIAERLQYISRYTALEKTSLILANAMID